jgi:hypothetical protein
MLSILAVGLHGVLAVGCDDTSTFQASLAAAPPFLVDLVMKIVHAYVSRGQDVSVGHVSYFWLAVGEDLFFRTMTQSQLSVSRLTYSSVLYSQAKLERPFDQQGYIQINSTTMNRARARARRATLPAAAAVVHGRLLSSSRSSTSSNARRKQHCCSIKLVLFMGTIVVVAGQLYILTNTIVHHSSSRSENAQIQQLHATTTTTTARDNKSTKPVTTATIRILPPKLSPFEQQPQITTFYDDVHQEHLLEQLPQWIQTYIAWHAATRRKYPGMKLFTDPEAPNIVMRTCLGLCGGLHDRIGQLPWDLYLAYKTNRVLLLSWQRPKELEHFLIPALGAGFNWTVPHEAKYGFSDMKHVGDGHRTRTDLKQLFEDMPEDHPTDEFWEVDVDKAIERATTGEFQHVKVLRHRILGHLGEEELDQRLEKLTAESRTVPYTSIHTAPLFGQVFWLFFRPSPAVDTTFRDILKEFQLVPYKYTAVHCRVRHPKATQYGITIMGKNPKYPADKTGLPWEGPTKQFAVDVAFRAIACAHTLHTGNNESTTEREPMYFLSDSNDLVRHVAHELSDPLYVAAARKNSSEVVDPNLFHVVSQERIVARDSTVENAHLDRQKGRDPPAYYGTFIDLLLAIHAHCVVYGIGYYAVFSAKVSGTTCKLLYQKEAWGKQVGKQTQICTPEMYESQQVRP